MTYTDNPNELVFLNDKNIVQGLTASLPEYNGVPSQKLFKETYDALSAYDKGLSDEVARYEASADLSIGNLCAELERHEGDTARQLQDISDWISGKAEISAEAVSAALRVQQLSTEMLSNRVDSMSATVESDYVHLTGDIVNGSLSVTESVRVDKQLSAVGQATFKDQVVVKGNLIQGESTSVTDVTRGIAMGISAIARHDDSFVWNGSDRTEEYSSHGPDGTFNINPEAGVNGFWIGERTLSTVIHDDTQLSVNDLTTQISSVSSDISARVDANRVADKSELSNVLSTYSNSLCGEISSRVELNRTADKEELSGVLSAYSNSLCAGISSTVMNAGYALYDKFEFTYDSNAHIIWLKLKDQLGRYNPNPLSVDSTEFIKNRILDSAEVTYDKEGQLVLRLYWEKPSGTSEGKYTDIKIADLAKIYKAGYGIQISEDLSVSVTEDVAKQVDISYISTYLSDALENRLTADEADIDSISAHADSLQDYANRLSGFGPDHGIIPTINDSLGYLSNYLTVTLDSRLTADEKNIAGISTDLSSVQGYVDSLSCKNGIVDQLSDDVSDIYEKIKHETAFVGHIEIDKQAGTQPWVEDKGNQLSSIFKHFNFAEDNKVKNGNVYDVKFVNMPNQEIDTLKVQYYDTDEPDGRHFRISDGDYIIVHSCNGAEYVDIHDIGPETVKVVTGVKRYEHFGLSAKVRDEYFWLSGGNTKDATWAIGHTNHAIGGNNDFLGRNNFEEISVALLSASQISAYDVDVEKLSASDVEIDDLSVYYAKADKLSAHDADVDDLSAHSAKIEQLSVFSMSADHLSAYDIDSEDISALNVAVQNKLSVAAEVDLLTSNVTIKDSEVKSEYKVTVNNSAEIAGNLSVDGKLTATNSIVEVEKATHIKSTLSVDAATTLGGATEVKQAATFGSTVSAASNLTVYNTLTATVSSSRADIVNLSAGTLTADFSNISDSGSNKTKYSTLQAFETSVELSVAGIDSRVDDVSATAEKLSTFNELKTQFNTILTSDDPTQLTSVQLYDIIQLLINVKNALSTF